MHIPDELLKAVVFIGRKLNAKDEYFFGGTGFFVIYPTIFGAGFLYLVTARHVIENLDGYIAAYQANLKSGGIVNVEIPTNEWYFHPTDETVDIAVLPVAKVEELDILAIPQQRFLAGWNINYPDYGLGDEVFFAGLFSKLGDRNAHIIRTGNLAIMPSGHVIPFKLNERLVRMEGYVIEGKSFGGMSGSPVFIRESLQFQPKTALHGATHKQHYAFGEFYLMGVGVGHWEIGTNAINDDIHDSSSTNDKLHRGLSIVAPVARLVDILNGEALSKTRDRSARNK